MDYCTYDKQDFLVMIDAWSRWPEVFPVNTMTAAAELIRHTRYAFATHGLPKLVVTDNGRQLVSADFESFLAHNGVKHLTSAPFFPQSNGQGENAVGSFKRLYKKYSEGDVHTKTARTMFAMRVTPSCSTGEPPAARVVNRRLRTPWDVMRPEPQPPRQPDAVQANLVHGEDVSFRDHRPGAPRFSPGRIMEPVGNRMYRVLSNDGSIHTRNINQLIPGPPPRPGPRRQQPGDETHIPL